MSHEVTARLKEAIITLKPDQTEGLTREGLEAGVEALELLNGALVPALEKVGRLFREGDYFLPDVLRAVKAYNNSFLQIEPILMEGDYKAKGTVMLGTVEGDIHEIGKNILGAMLQGNGYKVVDLGVQVTPSQFLEKAREIGPDIIGMSALLTTTMPAMRETIDLFARQGLRDQVKIIVGGSPVNQKFADEIGADGYGQDAQTGVELAGRLLA